MGEGIFGICVLQDEKGGGGSGLSRNSAIEFLEEPETLTPFKYESLPGQLEC